MDSILDSEQAAHFLGIQRATLYVYVSRGFLSPIRPNHNGKSYFRLKDLEEFLGRSRKRRFVAPALPAITTSITALSPRGPVYRGIPVATLIGVQRFESVADLLWEVESDGWPPAGPLTPPPDPNEPAAVTIARFVRDDPTVADPQPATVVCAARRLITAMACALAPESAAVRDGPPSSVSAIAAGAFSKECNPQDLRRAIETFLLVFADHELSPSTLVVRVAASERSGLANAFLVGLGVLSGHLTHSIARAHSLLEDAEACGAARAVAGHVSADGHLPGFGRSRTDDLADSQEPRFALMRPGLDRVMNEHQRDVVDSVIAAARAAGAGTPSIRLAAAGLAWAGKSSAMTVTNLLLVSRMAGWAAHYLEEAAVAPRRFRIVPAYMARASNL